MIFQGVEVASDHNYDAPDIFGVVVVVKCRSTDRLLLLRERKSNLRIFKQAGMLAFPSETREPTDNSALETVKRAAEEEVGLGRVREGDIFLRTDPITDLSHRVPIYAAWLYVEEEFKPKNIDPEVEFAGWFTEAEVRAMAEQSDMLRIETIPVLDVMIRGKGGAVV